MQRNTRQRTAILETLARQDDFRSAQQIHEQMKSDGESLYRQCEASGHHHHLVCRECGRTVEFLAPKLEASMSAIAGDHGFTDLDHTLEVFGLCSKHSRTDETEPGR